MGKEQELLEAARSGNFAVVEKILSQRAKKTGPLASLRRGPGANTQDQSGYTSLHHSALNGHKDIVSVLLTHEASTNVVDNKGSTPLHLAAWTGNTEIVKLLLVQGPSTPNVNLSNHDHETALHSAAQYGHTEVVNLLLQHGSDASVRNLKEESPLDLAAQYGRLDTVELLVKHRPELLQSNTQKHSPLHLASRNGHKQVVKVLLEAGFPVNLVTETGSALHEAALFGKIEVVKLLLDYRVDITIEDFKKRTVFDLLDDLNTSIAKQTRRLIKDHTTLVMTDDEMESPPSISPPPGFLSDSGSYANVLVPERPPLHSHMTGALGGGVPLPPFLHPAAVAGRSPPRSSSSPGSELFGYYEVPPPPRLASTANSGLSSKRSSGTSDQLYHTPPLAKSHDSSFESRSRSPSLYETPSPASMPGGAHGSASSGHNPDSIHSSAASLQRVSPLPIDAGYHHQGLRSTGMYRTSRSLESDAILYEIPPQSLLQAGSQIPGKRLSDPYQTPDTSSTSWTAGGYLPMSTFQGPHGNKPQPPAKPPRRSIAPVSPVGKYPPRSGYEYLCLATSAGGPGRPQGKMSRDDYIDMRRRTSYEGQSDNELDDSGVITNGAGNTANSSSPFSALYDDIASGKLSSGLEPNSFTNYLLTKSTPTLLTHGRSASDTSAVVGAQRNLTNRQSNYHPEIPSKPSTLDFKAKRATVQIPLSPTHYNQPPTPDFPPPSPGTAVTGIMEKIRPLSQESSDEGLEDDVDTVEYRNSKRYSRDIETLTDEEICATIEGNGQIRLTLRKENKGVATDNIEEVQEDNPFAGLCRGSIIPHKYRDGVKSGRSQHSKRPKNVYENVAVTQDGRGFKMVSLVGGKDSSGGGHNALDKGVCLTGDKRGSSSLAVMSPFDENAEWAEIADIMASFGSGIARESVFAQEIEEHFANVLRKESEINSDGRTHFTTVEEWLRIIGLSDYENILIINGFDDVNFLGGNILEEQDLLDIGVSSAEHRRILVNSARKLPVPTKPLERSSQEQLSVQQNMSVNEWLRSLHLGQYQEVFHRNGFTDMNRVMKLWEVELNTVLEIIKIGHQKRILASLGDRSSDRNFNDLGDLDLTKLNLTLCELGLDDSSDDLSSDSFLFKDYSNVTPRSTPNSADSLDSGASSISDTLRIRPPTQLMSEPGTTVSLTSPQQVIGAMPSFLTAQWRHDADTLVQNSCNYTAQYLGSTLVKELKGMESSRKSIQKLKTSTRDIGKIPYVILSISHQGVKFIDAQSQKVVCEHEIRNIHCACQDSEDLDHFAYITKEHQTNNHYCHVFSAQNTDLATEIILTLGQAFEVAYQLALRDKSKNEVPSSKDTSAAPSPVPPSSSGATPNSAQAAASRQFVSQLNVQLVPKTHQNGDAAAT